MTISKANRIKALKVKLKNIENELTRENIPKRWDYTHQLFPFKQTLLSLYCFDWL